MVHTLDYLCISGSNSILVEKENFEIFDHDSHSTFLFLIQHLRMNISNTVMTKVEEIFHIYTNVKVKRLLKTR